MPDNALITKPINQPTEILSQLHSGQLLRVNGCRGSALIICHRHHAELAGPGAGIGSMFDINCSRVIPIGNPSVVCPESRAERQKAYEIRQQWIRFTQKAMENCVPLQRARVILVLFEKYFGFEATAQMPDEILAQLVGVLPKTIQMARRATSKPSESTPKQSTVKVLSLTEG